MYGRATCLRENRHRDDDHFENEAVRLSLAANRFDIDWSNPIAKPTRRRVHTCERARARARTCFGGGVSEKGKRAARSFLVIPTRACDTCAPHVVNVAYVDRPRPPNGNGVTVLPDERCVLYFTRKNDRVARQNRAKTVRRAYVKRTTGFRLVRTAEKTCALRTAPTTAISST